MTIPLSVLDLAPVAVNSSAAQALQNSVALARHVDLLGYTRYWMAEHHNIPSFAIAAPEIMVGIIARETQRLRVGSGGMMLLNHAPLQVAERFRMLEALYPERIDLGVGRAPGTDPLTAYALRQSRERLQIDNFPDKLAELIAFGQSTLQESGFATDHEFHDIATIPTDVALPPIWLLGSSRDFSATLAGRLGLGFAFAFHINASMDDATTAVQTYHKHFVPNESYPIPHALLAVSVLCSESTDRANELATVLDLSFVRRQRKEMRPLPTLDEALNYQFSPVERAQADQYRKRHIIGDPPTVATHIQELAAAVGADELLIMTTIADNAERKRSYELVAAASGLPSTI